MTEAEGQNAPVPDESERILGWSKDSLWASFVRAARRGGVRLRTVREQGFGPNGAPTERVVGGTLLIDLGPPPRAAANRRGRPTPPQDTPAHEGSGANGEDLSQVTEAEGEGGEASRKRAKPRS